jgi:galactose mutarotase-like enzyme
MPLAVGYHTNFREPARLAVPIGQRWETDARYLPTGRLLELDSREKAYRDGFTPDGGRVSGFFTAAGLTAEIGSFAYTVSEPFDQWILYNGDGQQGFVSIEPQVGPVTQPESAGFLPHSGTRRPGDLNQPDPVPANIMPEDGGTVCIDLKKIPEGRL